MNMKMNHLVCIILAAFSLSSIISCSNNNKIGISQWTRQKNPPFYTIDDLRSLSIDETDALLDKYIKIEFPFSSTSVQNNIYYNNIVTGKATNVEIYCFTYQNYWDLAFNIGESLVAEGYVEYANKYSSTIVSLKPSEVKRAPVKK